MTTENQEFTPMTNPATDTAQDMFTAVLHERLASGALEQAITKRVDKLIEETADDLFRSYGEVGKALKEKLSASIMPQIESLEDLPVYHDFVMNRLKLAAQNFYDSRLADVVDAELKEIMTELPEEVTLSWLIEKLTERARSYNDDPEGEITLIIEERTHGRFMMVYLDKNEGVSDRNCDYRLHLYEDEKTGKWEILNLRVNGEESGKHLCVGTLYGFEKILFNIYAMKGQIALDQGEYAHDYETSWSEY
ncbi:hypothetical protein DN730_09725 [Marinomonas piezotolerans]|uniref:Uncharacterized protein n=1 Tax=Marinomonas piezotolerans TaxID=2213058 RepID=A0A370UA60_9GAMM|nr:hypothetical protein [Marinomonas piezotolerans]RDL44654.1 hypothetical protein DN730_09725 [Marinomonas piezotolerans]